MPLTTYSWPTSITPNVTTGEIADTLAVYDRLGKIIGGWGARGPVVASSSSPQALQNTADRTCDGTADEVDINEMLATGRPVLLLPGTYNLAATITIPPGTGQILRGSGWGTVLKVSNGGTYYAITFSTTSGHVTGARLESFKVDANGTTAAAGSGGIYAKGAVQCLFDHLWVTNPYDAGLWLHEIATNDPGHHNRVRACLFDATGTAVAGHGQGVRMQASDENWIEACDFESWGGTDTEPYAIKDWSGINFIDRCNFVSGQEAIRVQDTGGTRITQPMFDGVGRDCIHIVGSGCTILGGTFSGGGQATAGTYSHIVLDGTGGHSITGGVHSTDATAGRLRSFIRELGTTNNTVVTGKVLTVNGTLGTAKVERNSQTGNRYRAIIGYEDELFVRKTANESVTSSVTLQNDDHLILAVEANNVYELTGLIIYDGATTGDIKLGWTVPAAATLDWSPQGPGTAATSATTNTKQGHDTAADSESLGAAGTGVGNRLVARVVGLLQVAGTAGNVQFQWAQSVSDVTATTVLANSYLRLRRVA